MKIIYVKRMAKGGGEGEGEGEVPITHHAEFLY